MIIAGVGSPSWLALSPIRPPLSALCKEISGGHYWNFISRQRNAIYPVFTRILIEMDFPFGTGTGCGSFRNKIWALNIIGLIEKRIALAFDLFFRFQIPKYSNWVTSSFVCCITIAIVIVASTLLVADFRYRSRLEQRLITHCSMMGSQ